jgi:hypothetical protein
VLNNEIFFAHRVKRRKINKQNKPGQYNIHEKYSHNSFERGKQSSLFCINFWRPKNIHQKKNREIGNLNIPLRQ